MKRRRPNPRLAKIHRNYTVDEVARLFGIHKGTVRHWVKLGLPTTDEQRPMLILGRDLRAFIEQRRAASKRPCAPGQIYCVRCRTPRDPAPGLVECRARGPSFDLVGICPNCGTLMYRRVSLRNFIESVGSLQVTLPEGLSRIDKRLSTSV